MKNTIILLVLLRSVRWVLCQQCYIRQYSKLGQSTKIVTDKRAYRSQAEPEPRAYTAFTGYTVCIHTAANPRGRRCSALLFNVVDWFIYLPTASSTAAKTRSSPVGRGARIPLHRSPTAARAARRPLSGARRDAYKLAAAAYVYVVERDRENESSGGERGRLYRPELVCELEQKRSIFIGRLLHISLSFYCTPGSDPPPHLRPLHPPFTPPRLQHCKR